MKLLLALPIAFLLLVSGNVTGQNNPDNYYVTIGAFRQMENAVRFTATANKNGFAAAYAINTSRQLYYVYLLNTPDQKKAYDLLLKIKVETIYKDAWIFSGHLGKEPIVKTEEPAPEVKPTPEPTTPPVTTPPVQEVVKPVEKVDTVAVKKITEEKKPKGNPFYIRVVSKGENKELFGNLQLMEPGARQYQAIKSGEIIYLEAPRNKKGVYNLVAQLPGYKQSNMSFAYANPSATHGDKNETVITLTLDKAKRGDYIDFNNVHFYKSTAIMQPGSQNELDGLVTLLKENMKYKIKIYGHCNGTQKRESYTMGTSTDFFGMNPQGNSKATLSAKALSLARAEVVKAYLIKEGIDGDRISTKGEGGKIPLYPEGGTLGQYNDRVEIEFVKN